MVECAGLEIRCTVMLYRGFESHPFRQMQAKQALRGLFSFLRAFFCMGTFIAGLVSVFIHNWSSR